MVLFDIFSCNIARETLLTTTTHSIDRSREPGL